MQNLLNPSTIPIERWAVKRVDLPAQQEQLRRLMIEILKGERPFQKHEAAKNTKEACRKIPQPDERAW
jgi:hypothetical protein